VNDDLEGGCRLIEVVSRCFSGRIQENQNGVLGERPPLWSRDQSSWLQIRRPGFDSQHYQKKKFVGLERGALGLVSTSEELLDRKVAAPV
jgi:hypothetical protein